MNPTILMMGLNHSTAPVEVREHIALARCRQPDALAALSRQLGSCIFPEALVLATCNRTEVYALVTDLDAAIGTLRHLITDGNSQLSSANVYTHVDHKAVAHLFSVASGIDSMILGESEVLGQVRSAFANAAEARTIGPVLHRLLKDAIHAGKRSHTETAIGNGPRSVAYAAISMARQLLGSLSGKNVLIIGAGEMARRAAQDMADDGALTVMVTNRTFDKAEQLAKQINGRAVQFSELESSLERADLVITATAAPHILLDADMIRKIVSARTEPVVLIDIAVPRNIAPEIRALSNVTLKNIDDLCELTDSTRGARELAVRQVRAIIEEEADHFWKWFMERRAAPTIEDMRDRAEAIRVAELDKALGRLGHLQLSERDRNIIAALSAGIVNKLLAAPTLHLKERTQSGDGQIYLSTVRELFDLDPDEHTDIPSAI